MGDGGEVVGATGKAIEIEGEAPGALREDVGATSEVAKILESITTMPMMVEQPTNMVCEASGEASNAHSGSVRDVTRLPLKKGKVIKEACPKTMKAR